MAEKRIRRETSPITTAITTTTILDLHPDLLHLVVKRLDQKSLRSITLASPIFVPLTNVFITELTFCHLIPYSIIHQLFNRFPSATEINLKSTSIARALTAMSNSSLKIESVRIYGNPTYPDRRTILRLRSSPGKLKDVKKLKVEWFGKKVGSRRMVEFIKIFSGIGELELSSGGRWDNAGIRLLLNDVGKNLRTIKIGANEHLSHEALNSLAAYCRDLQHFFLDGCSGVSPENICGFVRIFPNLHSLCLPVFSKSFRHAGLVQLGNLIGGLRYLTQLSMCDHMVNDDVLKAIGRLELSLTCLNVEKVGTRGLYTMKGVGALLNAARSLVVLKVSLPELDLGNQDREMSQLVKLLSHLKHIDIQTRNWFHETVFSLIDNCHKLETIIIHGDNAKCGSDIHVSPPKNKNVSVECICIKPKLEDSLRMTLQSSCPCLKWLKSS